MSKRKILILGNDTVTESNESPKKENKLSKQIKKKFICPELIEMTGYILDVKL